MLILSSKDWSIRGIPRLLHHFLYRKRSKGPSSHPSLTLLFLGLSKFSQNKGCDRQLQVGIKRNGEKGEKRKLRILTWTYPEWM